MTHLTKQQEQALQLNYHTVIFAGAGSGKTRVLVEKYLSFLERFGREGLEKVLAITFTNKAALEMKERIRERIQSFLNEGKKKNLWMAIRDELDRAYISTIHSCLARLLRENAFLAQLDPSFRILDEEESNWVIEFLLEESFRAWEEEQNPDYIQLLEHYDPSKIRKFLSHLFTLQIRPGNEELHPLDIQDPSFFVEEIFRRNPKLYLRITSLDRFFGNTAPHLWREFSTAFHSFRKGKVTFSHFWQTVKNLFIKENGSFRSGFVKHLGVNKEENNLLKGLARLLESLSIYLEEEKVRQWEDLAKTFVHRILNLYSSAMERYKKWKEEQNALDFFDLEYKSKELLERHPEIGQFEAVLVDEFQDTDHLQWELIQKLTSEKGVITIVGDLKQSIYEWRGAETAVFQKATQFLMAENRKKGFSQGIVKLTKNFRSLPEVLDTVNRFFSSLFEEMGIPFDHLEAQRNSSCRGKVELLWIMPEEKSNSEETKRRECTLIAKRILEGVEGKHPFWVSSDQETRRAEYSDIAVLIRSRTILPALEETFRQWQIPYQIVGGSGFYQAQEIKDLLALLKHMVDPEDDYALFGLLRSPFFGASDEILYWISLFGKGSLYQRFSRLFALIQGKEKPNKAEEELLCLLEEPMEEDHPLSFREWVEQSYRLLEEWRTLAPYMSPSLFLRKVMEETGMLASLAALSDGEAKIANLEKFLSLLRQKQSLSQGLWENLRQIEWLMEEQDKEGSAPFEMKGQTVKIMTIHAAKGMEFPIVFIPDLARDWSFFSSSPFVYDPLFGVASKVADPKEKYKLVAPLSWKYLSTLEEEKRYKEELRLLYVALTRAKDWAVLSCVWEKNKVLLALSPLTWLFQEKSSEINLSSPTFLSLESSFGFTLLSEEKLLEKPQKSSPSYSPQILSIPQKKTWSIPSFFSLSSSPPCDLFLSPTLLSLYHRCPRRFYYEFFLKLPSEIGFQKAKSKISDARLFGTIVHRGVELLLGGLSLPQTLKQLSHQYITYFREEEKRKAIENILQKFAKSSLVQKLKTSSVQVEHPILGKWGKLHWQGTIDLLWKKEKEVWILDFKTTSPSLYSQEKLKSIYSVPLALYAYSYWKSEHPSLPLYTALVLLEQPDQLICYDPWTEERFCQFELELAKWEKELSQAFSHTPLRLSDFPPYPSSCPSCPHPSLCQKGDS